MIKINLLKSYNLADSDVLKEMEELRHVKVEISKRVFVMLLGPIALYAYEYINIPELMNQRSVSQTQLSQLIEFNQRKEAMAKEIAKYEEDKKRINRQTRFLERVSRERLYPVDFLNKVSEIIPRGVWLDSLNVIGKRIEVRGQAETESAVSEFEAKLTGISFLKGVKLLGIDSIQVKGEAPIRTFTINAEFINETNLDKVAEVIK